MRPNGLGAHFIPMLHDGAVSLRQPLTRLGMRIVIDKRLYAAHTPTTQGSFPGKGYPNSGKAKAVVSLRVLRLVAGSGEPTIMLNHLVPVKITPVQETLRPAVSRLD